jgi:hypothetical protein
MVLVFRTGHNYIQSGPKKCTHFLMVNIFGTKWHVVTILRGKRVSHYMCSKWPPSAAKQRWCRRTAERTNGC